VTGAAAVVVTAFQLVLTTPDVFDADAEPTAVAAKLVGAAGSWTTVTDEVAAVVVAMAFFVRTPKVYEVPAAMPSDDVKVYEEAEAARVAFTVPLTRASIEATGLAAVFDGADHEQTTWTSPAEQEMVAMVAGLPMAVAVAFEL